MNLASVSGQNGVENSAPVISAIGHDEAGASVIGRDRNNEAGRPASSGAAPSDRQRFFGEPDRQASTIAKRCV